MLPPLFGSKVRTHTCFRERGGGSQFGVRDRHSGTLGIIPLRILLYSMCVRIKCTVSLKSALGKVEMVVGSLSGDICQ